MMHPSGGLYKALGDMLNSGALSPAPHNRVDADAAESAPNKGRQTRRVLGGYLTRQKQVDNWPAVTTWNAPFERIARKARDLAPLVRALATQ